LLALVEKAKTVQGYVIEVKGYASTSGSASLNQKLSEDRGNNVTNVLLQKGHIPLTQILAPGAMGEAHQVGNDKSARPKIVALSCVCCRIRRSPEFSTQAVAEILVAFPEQSLEHPLSTSRTR